MKRYRGYRSVLFAGSRTPVNRQAAVVASAAPRRIRIKTVEPNFRLLREDQLIPIPSDGNVSLRVASHCRFIPKAVMFRNERKWLEPMDWEAAFDAALELLDKWFGPTLQYVDEKYLGAELPADVEPQWTYCYCLRHICKFLELTNDDIVFQAFMPKVQK